MADCRARFSWAGDTVSYQITTVFTNSFTRVCATRGIGLTAPSGGPTYRATAHACRAATGPHYFPFTSRAAFDTDFFSSREVPDKRSTHRRRDYHSLYCVACVRAAWKPRDILHRRDRVEQQPPSMSSSVTHNPSVADQPSHWAAAGRQGAGSSFKHTFGYACRCLNYPFTHI